MSSHAPESNPGRAERLPNLTTRQGDYADNWTHVKYKYLVHAAENFIVFIDDEIDVDWETSPAYDAVGYADGHRHNAILNDAALLESTPCGDLRDDVRLHFKRLIGEAIVRSLHHDYVSAASMLKAASTYILARSQEKSRFWYLSASFAVTAPVLLAGTAFWVWRGTLIRALNPGVYWLGLSAVAGSLGALLSVIGRTGKLVFDCSSGKALHYLEGASRICAGALSGVVVGLAVRTGVVLAPLSGGDRAPAVMMLAAFAAGAGERLAPSIISTIGTAGAKATPDKGNTQGGNSD